MKFSPKASRTFPHFMAAFCLFSFYLFLIYCVLLSIIACLFPFHYNCVAVFVWTAQECYELYWTNPRSNTPQHNYCIAAYIGNLLLFRMVHYLSLLLLLLFCSHLFGGVEWLFNLWHKALASYFGMKIHRRKRSRGWFRVWVEHVVQGPSTSSFGFSAG